MKYLTARLARVSPGSICKLERFRDSRRRSCDHVDFVSFTYSRFLFILTVFLSSFLKQCAEAWIKVETHTAVNSFYMSVTSPKSQTESCISSATLVQPKYSQYGLQNSRYGKLPSWEHIGLPFPCKCLSPMSYLLSYLSNKVQERSLKFC